MQSDQQAGSQIGKGLFYPFYKSKTQQEDDEVVSLLSRPGLVGCFNHTYSIKN